MFIKKNIGFKSIMAFTGGHLIWISAWTIFVTALHEFTHWEWMSIPWLPISMIGVAVAFYVGFKNNQAYDRLWEARKIWGGIVNSSRAWGSYVKNFVGNQFSETEHSSEVLHAMHKRLIHHHIGWLYTLRNQLLIPTPWEHISQGGHVQKTTERRRKVYGVGLYDDGIIKDILNRYFKGECTVLINYKNTATQIIDKQGAELSRLRKENLIDDFRHMELQKILYEFYNLQGKCERIKKFPLPRQYGSMSFVFIGIFIFLLPFGVVTEFHEIGGDYGAWRSIPFTILIAWIFVVMELIGDYSENPFEGLGNDIPMLALCRTIEIDLLEMLGEEDIPAPIQAQKGVLM